MRSDFALVGIGALVAVGWFVTGLRPKARKESAVSIIALYWHFMGGLWCYLLALLLITVQ